MKIATFGCSWSFGVPRDWSLQISDEEQRHRIPKEDYVCWPRELGKLAPGWEITNFAVPGSDIFFSCSMLERALDYNYDLYIFQATTPYRFTYWTDDLIKEFVFKNYETNVRMGTKDNLKNVNIVNIHSGENNVVKSHWRDSKVETSFVRNYYKRISNDMFESQFRILCDWAKAKSDFFFSHLDYQFLNCPTVQGTLGKKKFNRLVCDSGSHFGVKGAQWQAKWILDQINTL